MLTVNRVFFKLTHKISGLVLTSGETISIMNGSSVVLNEIMKYRICRSTKGVTMDSINDYNIEQGMVLPSRDIKPKFYKK